MQPYPKLHDTLSRLFNHLEHCDAKVSSALTSQAIDLLPRWIPVTERLPKSAGEYLVTDGDEWSSAEWCDIFRHWVAYSPYIDPADITHWSDPPQLPTT